MHQYIALEDTVYFGFAANLTTGAAGDGATPVYDVRLAGAAAGAAPVLSGTPTLLTHANYTDGLHEVAIDATAANGFAAGNTYLVFVSLTISSVTPAACIGSFRIAPVPANLTQIGGVAQSATDLKDFADDGYDPSTNKVQGVVLTDTVTTYTGNTPQTGDSFARIGATGSGLTSLASQASVNTIDDLVDDLESRLGTPSNLGSGATVAANLVDIEAQTDDIGAAGAGLTALGDARLANLDAAVSSRSTVTTAQVNAEVDTALADVRLDELLAADSDIDGAAPPTVGSVFHELMSKTAGSFTFDQTTDSNEAIRDRGDSAWATAVGFSTHAAADVWAVATRLLTAGTNIVLAKGVGVTGFNDLSSADVTAAVPTAAAIADQVWEETLADHSGTVGSTAEQLAAAGAAGDPWATPLPGAYGGGSAGKIVGDNLNATVSSRSSHSAADVWTAILEGAYTAGDFMRGFASALFGKLSGAATTTNTFRDPGDTKNRIVSTVDSDGNRTNVTLDLI